MNIQKRIAIYQRLQEQNPHPTTELIYHSSFELLIAVMLSAQATDKGVNLATAKLFSMANTPETILTLGEEKLITAIKTINYFRTKAKNIIKTCHILMERYQGEIPSSRADLETLPGVGRKTANVILNTAFGQAVMAVDTHIFRVANRTKLAIGKTPREVEEKLMKVTPKAYLYHAHHWLILHGRYTCLARKPACARCIIRDLCEFQEKSTS